MSKEIKLTRGYMEGAGRKTYILRGPNAVATFAVFYFHGEATGTMLDLHSRVPWGSAEHASAKPCEFLGGDPCYFDGTSLEPVPESPEDAYRTLDARFGGYLREL